jgi:hypothetical protein
MTAPQVFTRFMACRQGAFMILAALVLVVLLGLVGLAVDTARLTLARTNMQAAADVSVLAAGATYRDQLENRAATSAVALAAARRTAERYFLANLRTTGIAMPESQLLDTFTFQLLPSAELQVTYNAPVALGFGRFASQQDAVTPAVVARVRLGDKTSAQRLPLELTYLVDSSKSMAACTDVPATGIPAGSTCLVGYIRKSNGTLVPKTQPGIPASTPLRNSVETSIETIFEGEAFDDRIKAKIITYSNTLLTNPGFVSSKTQLQEQLRGYDPAGPRSQDTNILTPVAQAGSELSAYVSPATAATNGRVVEVIVLMSDGRHNIQPPLTAIDNALNVQPVINACRDFSSTAPAGTRREVFTVFFRTQKTNATAQQNAEAERLLRECASQADYAFTADDTVELSAAYRRISREIVRITTIGRPQLSL